jgi:hypothetical protein
MVWWDCTGHEGRIRRQSQDRPARASAISSGELPVQRSTKVEMFLNLKAAKALGITVPLPLLGRADQVIERSAARSYRCSAVRRSRGRRAEMSRLYRRLPSSLSMTERLQVCRFCSVDMERAQRT